MGTLFSPRTQYPRDDINRKYISDNIKMCFGSY